jgi:D-sedoheptulose 7-phosphate isomerase
MNGSGDLDTNFNTFVDDYYARFVETVNKFDKSTMPEVLRIFTQVADSSGTIWVAGNGGSAAISDHAVCDTTKLTYVDGKPPVKAISLASNGPMLTALANDFAYEDVFSKQLEYYLEPEDAVLLVSSSGNSPNVVEACKFAQERGAPTIAFVGFKGGELKRLADHVVHIEVDNYGIAEDTHQSLMHVLTQYIKQQRV